MKKRPSSQPNTLKEENVKNGMLFTLGMGDLRQKPISNNWFEKLALDLINWSLKKDSLVIKDFFNENKLVYSGHFKEWCNRCPKLGQAFLFAKQQIAARREKAALLRKMEPSVFKSYQPYYDEEYKNLEEWRASIKEKEKQGPKTIIVQMESHGDNSK